jgi:hypothetical protein
MLKGSFRCENSANTSIVLATLRLIRTPGPGTETERAVRMLTSKKHNREFFLVYLRSAIGP